MARIATFVFFDLETSGLPSEEHNRSRITELSMVAVRRDHILDQAELVKSKNSEPLCPRVINKLTLCLNPRKMITDGSTRVTGMNNELLEHQAPFDLQVFSELDLFLNRLEKPVCLVAHNGMNFDFPIFKNHLDKLNVHLHDDLLCADSLNGMYDIEEGNEERKIIKVQSECKADNIDVSRPLTAMKAENETTPFKRKLKLPHQPAVKRRLYFDGNTKPSKSYKVSDIHARKVGGPPRNAHRAEDDCMMLVEIAVMMGSELVQWFDDNHLLFSNVKPMTPGVRLGE
ncbi:three prime repair exonuclease 2-like [Manduca sexta]|uniref:three prime repair exonuclease 2-like n=1 Tax=Manduca sexta TaxID=7130 RepID=UPI00188EA123|nr:three prime repair exonuclease 2-like [Manduca sexta]